MAASTQLQSAALSSSAFLSAPSSIFSSTSQGSCIFKQSNVTKAVIRSQKKDKKRYVRRVAAPLAGLAGFAALPMAASAVTPEDVSSAITQVQDIAGKASETAVFSFEYAKKLLDQLAEVTRPAVEAATPFVQGAAQKAFDATAPVASNLTNQAQKALSDAGIDTKPVIDAAKTASSVAGEVGQQTGQALTAATPYAESTLEKVLAQDPTILGLGAGALVLLYFLAPAIGSAIAYKARGYAGNLTAAQALDLVSTRDYTLIDVRSEKEKGKSGVPSLPRNSKKNLISIPVDELQSKLRGQLRNAKRVEAELTAIKIASLKRLGKGSNIILLDAYGDTAKAVAKSLSALGFRNASIIKDGMDGNSGWVASQLGTEGFNYSRSEVLSPSRIIPAASRALGTLRGGSTEVVDVAPRRGLFLTGGSDD